MKKFLVLLLSLCLALGMCVGLVGCNCASSNKTKIGVLVVDASGEEALSFRSYYKDYIASQYNVEFVYSPALTSEDEAKSQV